MYVYHSAIYISSTRILTLKFCQGNGGSPCTQCLDRGKRCVRNLKNRKQSARGKDKSRPATKQLNPTSTHDNYLETNFALANGTEINTSARHQESPNYVRYPCQMVPLCNSLFRSVTYPTKLTNRRRQRMTGSYQLNKHLPYPSRTNMMNEQPTNTQVMPRNSADRPCQLLAALTHQKMRQYALQRW